MRTNSRSSTQKTWKIKAAWKSGPDGFFAWCRDVQPRILTGRNKYEVFDPLPWQRDAIEGTLAIDDNGDFINDMALLVTPRRHGKTQINGLIVLWLATTRENYTIQVLGNTEDHVERIQMKTLKGIIANTPKLADLIKEKDIQRLAIKVLAMKTVIQASGVNLAGAFGDKLNLLWVGDFHACPDQDPFDAYQASLLDSENTLCLIDSNPDVEGGHVHALENEAKVDDRFYCCTISYKDFEDYAENAPPWLDRHKADKIRRTKRESVYKRDILGQRTAPVNALFKPEEIEACIAEYAIPVPPALLPEMFDGRKYVIGAGLDKAKAIKFTSFDKTVWTVVLKVPREDGEPEYWIMSQEAYLSATTKRCKKFILDDSKKYDFINIALESYETEEIYFWGIDQGLPMELANPSAQKQYPVFTALHSIVAEGRLRISKDCKELLKEMHTFMCDDSTKIPSFAHAKGFHDDHVYSLAWAIWSLRQQELGVYELNGIDCTSRNKHASFCYLRGGDHILPCADQCTAQLQVKDWWQRYRMKTPESDISIPEFYQNMVTFNGFATWHHM